MKKMLTPCLTVILFLGVGAGLANGQTSWNEPPAESRPAPVAQCSYAEEAPPTVGEPSRGGDELPGIKPLPAILDEVAEVINGCPSGGCASCDCSCEDCCDDKDCWINNTQVWFGGELYKSIGDSNAPLGVARGSMDSAGLVTGFNTGFALGSSQLRGQIGMSYGAYDFLGRDFVPPAASAADSLEQQIYLTAGVYKRSDICEDDHISYGLVYDQFFGHQWGAFGAERSLGQVRGIAGYAVSECNEFGVWGTFHITYDQSFIGIDPARLRTMNQANVYWRHHYELGASTMLYVGAMDPADIGSWQFGLTGEAPMSQSVSLYANFNYVVPGAGTGPIGANELQWDAGVGLAFYFGGKAVSSSVSGNAGMPLLPVANNGSLLITN